MKKLPKIYQTEINKKICNNKRTCYLKNEETKKEEITTQNDIREIINEVFSGIGHSYNIPLTIKTKERTYQTSLIAKNKRNIVTLDNEVIPISDIITIKKN